MFRLFAGQKLHGIRFKLALFSLALLLLPTLVVGFVSYHVAKEETDELIRENLRDSVQLVIETIEMMEASVQRGEMTRAVAQEQVKIMLLGSKTADGKRPINKSIDLGPNGYFFVLDDKGTELAHPSLEGQNIWDKQTSDGEYFIQDMIHKAIDDRGGFTIYSWPLPNSTEEAEKITYAELAPEWGWIICAGSYWMDFNMGQDRIWEMLWITLAVCMILGGIGISLFSRHLVIPLKKLAAESRRIAEGDLTARPMQLRRKDEIGQLSEAFNQMNVSLNQLIRQASTSTVRLSVVTEELTASVDETIRSVEQVTQAVQEVAQDMENHSAGIEETGRAMEEMTRGIIKVAEASSVALESSSFTAERAEAGDRMIEQSNDQMQAIRSTVHQLAAEIGLLNDRSREIGEIIQLITDIAGQTNLLALNAAIEAARAGEEGKGFAVVAGEVRKLAERSQEAAGQVTELVDAIRTQIEHAVEAMDRGEREVAAGASTVEETGRIFNEIHQAARTVLEQIQEASASSQQMSAGAEQISAALQEVTRIAETTGGRAQSILASSEEQLAAMEQIGAMNRTLNELMNELKSATANFKTE
jgi:methyl-accepting chemotaxis protein